MAASPLASRLSLVLPNGLRLHVHHVVRTTAPCAPIFALPPASKPDDTTQESHTLSVSIDHEGALLHILALEVDLYETTSLTTLFVSKADSTGYGYLQTGRHPLVTKSIVIEFLCYLIATRRRDEVKFVISLFARAQDQYLYPGSIENARKHVLDDRQLIKWWCKILDRVLRRDGIHNTLATHREESATVSRGFLKVPGCDSREVQSFFPKDFSNEKMTWTHGDPLKSLQTDPTLPERCLIPRFPDDPKARFAIDLDDELPENQLVDDDGVKEEESGERQEDGNLPVPKNPPTAEYSPAAQPGPPKPLSDGKWRSVRSLDQFWELMGFRQECAAGRLVGFIWGVIGAVPSPPSKPIVEPTPLASTKSEAAPKPASPIDLTLDGLASPPLSSQVQPEGNVNRSQGPTKELPPVKGEAAPTPITPSSSQPAQAPPHTPDPSAVASHPRDNELPLPLPAYEALSNILQTGDYSTLALAKATTAKWVETLEREIRIFGGEAAVERSRIAVVGLKEMAEEGVDGTGKAENGVSADGAGVKRQGEGEADVKVLAAGLVRKKRKVQS